MAPWPHQPCPHSNCGKEIRDLLAEMVSNTDQQTPEFRAILSQAPGGAITCPYCQAPVEYGSDGHTLVASDLAPLRFSRIKMEMRAKDYGIQQNPPVSEMTPEQWIAEEKLMPGALVGYHYLEDGGP